MKNKLLCMLLAVMLILPVVAANAEFASFLPTRQFEGVTYEARSSNSVTTMLLIGYDHNDEGALNEIPENFIQGGQSDFLLLLVFDHENKVIRQLQPNRDTITPVRYYTRAGEYRGLRDLQLCLSHAYGDTQELNNKNTIWAVENLLGISGEYDGAQIDYYISMDISGIAKLNDLLGGVTVPIEDDFSHVDPSMVMGTTMKLTGAQAERYCRGRHHVADSTNLNRMKRQRIYIAEASKLLKEKVSADPEFAYELLNGMGIIFDTTKDLDAGFGFTTTDSQGTPITDTPSHFLMTNQRLDDIVALMVRVLDYEIGSTEVLPGNSAVNKSTGFMDHIVEENAGLKWALDALYNPVN